MNQYQGTFRRLIVWQAAKKLTLEVYRLAKKFPKEEIYGLTSQMRRASVSVMSNIAEGNQRSGQQEKIHFFEIAVSSLAELDNQSDLILDLGYITQAEYDILSELINKVGYLAFHLIESKRNPNYRNNRNHLNNRNGGFSLVELLVVISIVAILSVSSVLGFGYLGQTLRIRESAGFLSDVVKQEELKVLRGDFDKAVIHFLKDYLVVEEWPTGATLPLNVGSVCGVSDSGTQIDHVIPGSASLTQKSGEGEVLQITSVGPTETASCVLPKDSADLEWNYQLASGEQFSPILRFVHFNLDRSNSQNAAHITNPSKMEIIAPYGKKRFYDSTSAEQSNLTIDLRNEDLTIFETAAFQ